MFKINLSQLLTIFSLVLFATACNLFKPVPEKDSISTTVFLETPFSKTITPEYLEENLGRRLKEEKIPVSNIHNPEQTDTVLVMHYRSSSFYFYLTSDNRALFYEANIKNPRIRLIADLRTGIKKDAFREAFRDINELDSDTLQVIEDEFSKAIFEFKRDRLQKIKIENYLD
ncbi:MAG: hypothetical protein EA412_11675 [Chitinophagaceae bacterium]|nr:MAG: hypothetical protein EA412_11675 [Chitinophagaceae bacterium]